MDQNRIDFGVEGTFSVKLSASTRNPISKPLEKSGGPLSKRICADTGKPQTITRRRSATDSARRIMEWRPSSGLYQERLSVPLSFRSRPMSIRDLKASDLGRPRRI